MKKFLAPVLAGLLALGGTVAIAAPASAHTNKVSAVCDSLTVTLTSYQVSKNKQNEVFVEVDEKVLENNTKFGQSYTKKFSFDPYTAHSYKVRVHAQDDPNGKNGWSFTKTGTTTPCEKPKPEKPVKDDVIVVTESAPDCEAVTVDVTTSTTVFSYVFDEKTWTWIESSETTSETVTREATLEECPPVVVPEKPKPIVTEASSESVNCETDVITTTKTVTTTDYVLVDNVWVKQEPVTVETVTTRPATDRDCPDVETIVTEPVVFDQSCEDGITYDGGIYVENADGLVHVLEPSSLGQMFTDRGVFYSVAPGQYTITFTVQDGFKLAAGDDGVRNVTVLEDVCETPVPPVTEPPAAVPAPAPAPTPDTARTASREPRLAHTGPADGTPLYLFGAGFFVAAGFGLRRLSKTRQVAS